MNHAEASTGSPRRCAALVAATAACSARSDDSAQAAPATADRRRLDAVADRRVRAPPASIHKIAGEQFVDRLNASGGLLGRPVEWKVLDDQSDQAKVGQLYEQLITQDKVDLIIGPYATPNILSAMAVAERHGYVMPQHTAVLAPQLTYDCQFPAWSIGPTPNEFIPNQLFDAVATPARRRRSGSPC